MSRYKDLTNKRFGKLVAIKPVESEKKGIMWLCKCDCGNETTSLASYLTSGHKTSCGCLRWTGDARRTHGMSSARIHTIWSNMKKRCTDSSIPDYKNYGGKGITYCSKWEKFEGFYEDMREGYSDNLTLDRIDVEKGYCKGNCRWVDMKTQANNKTNNHYVMYKGEKLTISQLAEKCGIKYDLLKDRINKGWDIEEALKPVKVGELITYNGITKTVAEFAEEYCMTYHQLKKRLMRGWSIEKALTQPLRK